MAEKEQAKSTKPVLLGRSIDGRTNRWRVTCPSCQKSFVPVTTMFKSQSLDCPHRGCGGRMVAHYDDDIVVVGD